MLFKKKKLSKEARLSLAKERELQSIFTDDIVNHLKNNQDEITYDLLKNMRSFGNCGKKLALEILDMKKDEEQFYLDSFGNRCAFDGNRQLKKRFTKFDLYPIHEEEIERCMNDIHYYKDNYIKIRTKSGVDFPEMRSYQNSFLDDIVPDEHESLIGLMGRQCCSADTVVNIRHNDNESEMTFEDLFNEVKNEK